MPPPAHVTAGWYPDPDRRMAQRCWDDARWTEHSTATPAK
ncbi:DUF2510 domain-containing protein [Nocardia sp. NPDC059239]